MRAPAVLLLCALSFPAAASMNGLGGDDDKKVEVPTAPDIWQATVTDSTLTETALDEFTIDGLTMISGARGAGTIAIKFDEIAHVQFESAPEKGKVIALVAYKAGGTEKLTLDGKTPLYGKTAHGNFKVLTKETKKLVFTAGPIKRSERSAAKKP